MPFLIVIFFFAFFQGVFQLLGVPTIVPRLILEISIVLLFLKTIYILKKRGQKVEYKWGFWIASLVLITVLSGLFNLTPPIPFLLFTRHVFIFYFLFIAIYNMDISEKNIRLVNRFLVKVFFVQIIASVTKLLYYGRIVEGGGIGTVSVQSGSLAVVLALVPISFVFSRFLYFKKKKYILVMMLFLIISIASGKRATAFLLPILLFWLTMNYFSVHKNIGIRSIFRSSIYILILSLGLLYITSQTSQFLNPAGIQFSGSFDIKFMLEKLTKYVFGTSQFDPGAGRGNAIFTLYNYSRDQGIDKVFFGFGPGSVIGSFLVEGKRDIGEVHKLGYGVRSGLLWIILQIGFIGGLFYTIFIFAILIDIKHLYKKYRGNVNHSPILLGIIGSIYVFIFDFTFYSNAFLTTGAMTPLLFYLTAIYLSPRRRLQEELKYF